MTKQTRRQPTMIKVCNNYYLTLTIMARLEGITGGLSGKMGSAVFRQSGGKTIASQYQPIVKNPNTEGQQAQRAKFKLMSQLAAIMSRGFGSFIIKTRAEKGKSTQRNAFVQANFPLVQVTTDNQQVTATIPMEQLKLTSSFRHIPALDVDEQQGKISVDFHSPFPTEVTTVRIVTVGYVGGVAKIVDMRDVPSNNLPADVNLPAGKYTVLAYGLIPSESAKSSIDLDNIHTPNDQDFISAIELNAMVANGLMAETITVGANVEVTA